jgi:hypothetical protein
LGASISSITGKASSSGEGVHGVAETDIDLELGPRPIKGRGYSDPHTVITGFLPNLVAGDLSEGKDDSVICLDRANLPDRASDAFNFSRAVPEEIEITGRARQFPLPDQEQRCPLENEFLAVLRLTEPIQKWFGYPTSKHEFEIFLPVGAFFSNRARMEAARFLSGFFFKRKPPGRDESL